MAIYSSEYLKGVASRKQQLFEQKLFSVKNTPVNTPFDIFLSHSFLDKTDVQGLYQELTDFGFTVYVDWIVDPHLDRTNVTKASANLIQGRLKSSKTLLLAISTNAAMSKWMPWELGYVDGHTNKCAIIPVSKEGTPPKSFKGTEYLLLYPFIKKVPTDTNVDKLWVIESEYKYSTLERWVINGIIEENRTVNIFNS
ncbi:MAG: toll/interleukin-1 receptor domain-containing protein [Bacteroidota bacterium]|nr:MAG: toll/interleukin-1 receptor domain-containing protein [Bacteroidota bacterium]